MAFEELKQRQAVMWGNGPFERISATGTIAYDDLVDVYVQGRDHEELYQLAEALIEWDERITMWRIRHYKVVARVIGDQVVGTQGTPVEVLGKMIHHNFFPALWRARNQLTDRAKAEEGTDSEVAGHGI